MNERIKELAEQAGVIFVPASIDYFGERHPSDILTKTMDVEKFAELIVQECAGICDLLLDHKISSEWSRGTHDCSRAIKKHFGVE